MMKIQKTFRKKRSDRNHIIYELKVGQSSYIGVTHVESGAIGKSLQRRWKKHIQRAFAENKSWALCEAIRKYGASKFEVRVVQVIRGKSEAHLAERSMIRELKPKLNSDKRGIR